MKKIRVREILLLFFFLIVALLLAEIFLSLINYPKRVTPFTQSAEQLVDSLDEKTGKYRKIKYYINALNHRSLEPDVDVVGKKKVLLVGDSHLVGFDVDQSKLAAYRLMEAMNDHFRQETVVFNFARSGTTVHVQKRGIENYLQFFTPDLVLLVAYSGNDVIGLRRILDHKQDRSYEKEINKWNRYLKKLKHNTISRLHVYQILALAKWKIFGRPVQKREEYLQSLGQVDYLKSNPERLEDSLKIYRNQLSSLIHGLREKSKTVKVVVAVLPTKAMVDADYLKPAIQSTLEDLGITPEEAIEWDSRVHNGLVGLSESLPSVQGVIDLKAVFKEKGSSDVKYYRDDDWHLNEEGHAVVAEALSSFLIQMGESMGMQSSGQREA